jgi:hypothetical protein
MMMAKVRRRGASLLVGATDRRTSSEGPLPGGVVQLVLFAFIGVAVQMPQWGRFS